MNVDSKIQFLKKIGCDEVGHKNQTLLDHLVGVYNILKSWDAPEYVKMLVCFILYMAQHILNHK